MAVQVDRPIPAKRRKPRAQKQARGATDLTIWFVWKKKELLDRIVAMAKQVGPDGMWIAWPKKASPLATDVAEPDVRNTGLAHGLVDFKICAIDADWSGLKFQVRGRKKAHAK